MKKLGPIVVGDFLDKFTMKTLNNVVTTFGTTTPKFLGSLISWTLNESFSELRRPILKLLGVYESSDVEFFDFLLCWCGFSKIHVDLLVNQTKLQINRSFMLFDRFWYFLKVKSSDVAFSDFLLCWCGFSEIHVDLL